MTEQFCCSILSLSAYLRSCALCRSQGTRSFSISPRGVAFRRFCPVRMISTAREYFCLSFRMPSRQGLASGRSKDICAVSFVRGGSDPICLHWSVVSVLLFPDYRADFVPPVSSRMPTHKPGSKRRSGPSRYKGSPCLWSIAFTP